MDWFDIAKIVAAPVATAVLGWAEGTFKWGKTAIARLRGKPSAQTQLRVPRRSLRLLQTNIYPNENVFTEEMVSDPDNFPQVVPCLHCRLHVLVTNITPFRIATARYQLRLTRRSLRKKSRIVQVMFGQLHPPVFDRFAMCNVQLMFSMIPLPPNTHQVEVDLTLVDQFGNKHRLKKVRLRRMS